MHLKTPTEILVDLAMQKGEVPAKVLTIFMSLYTNYKKSLEQNGLSFAHQEKLFVILFDMVKEAANSPYQFPNYHKALRSPIDYYQFGIDFFRSLIVEERSKIFHIDNVEKMYSQVQQGENVVLLANHQSEGDPQIINLALEKQFSDFVRDLIFVAGDRVTTDPMAIPFSQGTNLLCIYSKRHIDHPPERKMEKQLHNRKTMHVLKDLLKEGGKAIYVAPSGGRDRPNAEGIIEVAPFDPQSIEMFRLMATEAKTPTHFYPLALATFDILPPPPSVMSELGELRAPKREGIYLSFGDEVDLNKFPGNDLEDRHERRKACAHYLWNLVKHDYALLRKE